MKKIKNVYVKRFLAAARQVAEQGLVVGGSGNMSWRINDGLMLITTTGSAMGTLSVKDVAVCRIKDETVLGRNKPSKEIGFHAGILRERADVNVILHFQSPWATVVSCIRPRIRNFFVIPEIPYYMGPVSSVPFLIPGSKKLADAVTAALMKHEMTILRNHGQVAVGPDFEQVISNALYFELACRVVVAAGKNVQYMKKKDADVLLRQGKIYRARRLIALKKN